PDAPRGDGDKVGRAVAGVDGDANDPPGEEGRADGAELEAGHRPGAGGGRFGGRRGVGRVRRGARGFLGPGHGRGAAGERERARVAGGGARRWGGGGGSWGSRRGGGGSPLSVVLVPPKQVAPAAIPAQPFPAGGGTSSRTA